jgi:hypothetical protein
MSDKIIEYDKYVFTNDGQTDVKGFVPKLMLMAHQIEAAGKITVYYGFHGTTDGELAREFDVEELADSLTIAKQFPDATMVQVASPTDPKIDYKAHDEKGRVLFTWCDSEKYIRTNKMLPSIVI